MSLIRVVYYIILYLFVYNNASDIQKIQIRGPNPAFASYTVLMREPLEIDLGNFSAVLKCTYKDFEEYRSSYYNYFKTSSFIISIREVSASMSSRWQCEVVDFNNTHINYSFDIRVKGAKNVDVKIGGFNEIYEETNLTVLEYDGIAEHDLEEGDVVDLTCGNNYRTGQIRIRYYGKDGKILFDAQDTGINYPLTFRILIKNKSVNQSYVECTYIAPTTQQEFTYRTILTVLANKNIRSSNDFIVTVNGMKLTPFPRKAHGRDRYLYNYIVGESIQLTCTKKNHLMVGDIYGKISNDNSKKVVTKDIMNTSSIYSTSIETTHLDGMIFQCYSTSESSNITAVDILFLKEHAQDPVIRGLSASNILYQYNTGENEWITYYKYSMKQVLNLTCITAINREPQWVYRDNITSVVNENKKHNTNYINYVFNMDVESNETIICKSTKSGTTAKRMTIIVLLNNYKTNEGNPTVFTVVGIITGILGVLIIGFLIFYYCRVKRNGRKGVPNVSFNDDNTLIAEFKSEWQET
ncbi:unnamed protein product [Arctia plantaginis]|uniref:Uncharacterized protein n=1 Tax=Arctia plantaginis TaxID=874455 RepID=A0A8S0YQG5_ARCPL|nr:unnamed protein product [Arctia plantaginis]